VVALETACWFPAFVTQSGRESSLGHKERKRKRAVSAADSFSFLFLLASYFMSALFFFLFLLPIEVVLLETACWFPACVRPHIAARPLKR
jgi:hypothetical protein